MSADDHLKKALEKKWAKTKRRLPPALEVFAVTNGVRLLTERQVLDWFYGPSCPNAALHENGWKCNWSGHSTPGLVERVQKRAATLRSTPEQRRNVSRSDALLRALRAELAAEASEALDRFTAVTPDDTARYAHSEDPRFTGGVTG